MKNIIIECLNIKTKEAHLIAMELMDKPSVNIHGPIHHMIDGAAFLTSLYNNGYLFDLEGCLKELLMRAEKMPGATCGFWGVCGSASSLGASLAIIHKTGPLSNNDFYKDNLELTSSIISNIANIGGPRCCKRNCFIALETACEFVKKYDIVLPTSKISCKYSCKNKECIKTRCPYFN